MSIHARTIPETPPNKQQYKRKLPNELTDKELNAKICRDVVGGCAWCDSLEFCQFGKEHLRREGNRE